LLLGDTLDAEHLEASYETGVLTLHIPVAESAKPPKVKINEGADGRTIEAHATRASA
jgi:HSP20 family protein